MSVSSEFSRRLADWTHDGDALRTIRRTVFVVEQGVPEALEWDVVDPLCAHALAHDGDGNPIGCGRLLPDGHIGRMAVLRPWRGRGVGAALLALLVELARERGHRRAILNAQKDAVPFYARYGFIVTGDEFEDAGIAHRIMERTLEFTPQTM